MKNYVHNLANVIYFVNSTKSYRKVISKENRGKVEGNCTW